MAKKPDKQNKILRVRVVFPDVKSLPEPSLLRGFEWGGRGPRLTKDGQVVGEVYVTTQQHAALKKIKKCRTEIIEDINKIMKSRQRQVGKGDRF